MVKPIAICSIPRSGANYILDTIVSHGHHEFHWDYDLNIKDIVLPDGKKFLFHTHIDALDLLNKSLTELGLAYSDVDFLYVFRHDRIRQAISLVIAGQRDLYRSYDPVDEDEGLFDTVTYNDIEQNLVGIAHWEYQWRRFFENNGIEPHWVYYEELFRGSDKSVLKKIVDFVGLEFEKECESKYVKLSGGISEKIYQQFLWNKFGG